MLRRTMLAAGIGLAVRAHAQSPGQNAAVGIDNFTFSPARLVVVLGTRVTWTNHDDIPHTVVSKEKPSQTHSPPLDTDDQFSLVFDTKGTYRFFCSLHPHMQSEVVVQ